MSVPGSVFYPRCKKVRVLQDSVTCALPSVHHVLKNPFTTKWKLRAVHWLGALFSSLRGIFDLRFFCGIYGR